MAQNDEFGYHEVVNLSSLLQTIWDDNIAEHGATKENAKLKKDADKISKLMFDFYQNISKASYNKFGK